MLSKQVNKQVSKQVGKLTRQSGTPLQRWADRTMAAIALLNLGLVLFDWSYIPLRDYYLAILPAPTQWYGASFKGIEPHRFTDQYLDQVDALKAARSLTSPQATALLQQLQAGSQEMIDENPFESAGKTGTLERIKNRMRRQVGIESSKQAFNTFWSQRYLQQVGAANAIAFFDRDIRPLIQTNYYRGIGEDSQPIDRFWQIDSGFMLLFAIDLLIRLTHLRRRYPRTSWIDVALWRWYDLFLLLPYWRWLRVIPTAIRLNHSRLVDLEPLRDRVTRGVVTSFSQELTEVVLLQGIEQFQNLLRQGNVAQHLLQPLQGRRYVDLNGIDEVDAIARQVVNLVVHRILPDIKPDLEALLNYTLTCVLDQSPIYRNLVQVPGMSTLSSQISDRMIADVTATAYGSLTTALDNPEGIQLTRQLIQRIGTVLTGELARGSASKEIETLLIDWLDELKVNYVENLSTQDLEALRQQKYHLYEITQGSSSSQKID